MDLASPLLKASETKLAEPPNVAVRLKEIADTLFGSDSPQVDDVTGEKLFDEGTELAAKLGVTKEWEQAETEAYQPLLVSLERFADMGKVSGDDPAKTAFRRSAPINHPNLFEQPEDDRVLQQMEQRKDERDAEAARVDQQMYNSIGQEADKIFDPKYRFEERVNRLMRLKRLNRQEAEEVVREVIQHKEAAHLPEEDQEMLEEAIADMSAEEIEEMLYPGPHKEHARQFKHDTTASGGIIEKKAFHENLLEFGVPQLSGQRVKKLLQQNGMRPDTTQGGGFAYFIFNRNREYNQAVQLVEKGFQREIQHDPDWHEWKQASRKKKAVDEIDIDRQTGVVPGVDPEMDSLREPTLGVVTMKPQASAPGIPQGQLLVFGYEYPNGQHGARDLQWWVLMPEAQFRSAVEQAKRQGSEDKARGEALYHMLTGKGKQVEPGTTSDEILQQFQRKTGSWLLKAGPVVEFPDRSNVPAQHHVPEGGAKVLNMNERPSVGQPGHHADYGKFRNKFNTQTQDLYVSGQGAVVAILFLKDQNRIEVWEGKLQDRGPGEMKVHNANDMVLQEQINDDMDVVSVAAFCDQRYGFEPNFPAWVNEIYEREDALDGQGQP